MNPDGVHPSRIMVSNRGVVSVRAVDVARSQAAKEQIDAAQRIRLQPKRMPPNAAVHRASEASPVQRLVSRQED